MIEVKDYFDYANTIRRIVDNGDVRMSRIGPTFELLGLSVKFNAGDLFARPKMNRALGWLEVGHVLGGYFIGMDYKVVSPGLMWAYNLDAAYGLKTAEQMFTVSKQLINHPNSRRAIVHIGKERDTGEIAKPCVDSYQFILNQRTNKLDLVMSVRSWDMVAGFIYDTMVGGALCHAMAAVVGLEPGMVYAHAATAHVYMKDIEDDRLPTLANKPPSTFHFTEKAIELMRQDGWAAVQRIGKAIADETLMWAEANHFSFTPSQIIREDYAND